MLDSVIGTFLTQNVADQLSSKAYMTLAAVFPAKPVAVKAAGWGSCGPAAASTGARPPTEETAEVCAGKCHMLMHELMRDSYHRAPVQGLLKRRL